MMIECDEARWTLAPDDPLLAGPSLSWSVEQVGDSGLSAPAILTTSLI